MGRGIFNLNIPNPHNPLAIAELGRLADLNAERFMLKPRRKVEITTAEGRKKKVYCEETIVFVGDVLLYMRRLCLEFLDIWICRFLR